MRRALLLTCLALGVTVAVRADNAKAPAGGQTPAFPAQVEQVTVDVVVADQQGTPITGLRREDFTLSEDGTPQAIASFEPIDVASGPPPTTALGQRVSSNTDAAKRTARTFVIVFDGLHITPSGAETAKKAIEKFVSTALRDDDYVMLLGTQSTTWVSTRFGLGRDDFLAALKRQKGTAPSDISWDYMSEYEALRIEDFHDTQVGGRVTRRWVASNFLPATSQQDAQGQTQGTSDSSNSMQPGMVDPLVADRARQLRHESRVKQDETLGLLRRVLDSLVEVKGRKSVLLVSEGFVVDFEAGERRPVGEAAHRANAAIYFIDARGLLGLPMVSSASWGTAIDPSDMGAYLGEADLLSEGCQAVAADSGGFTVRNNNDLAGAMARIARESQSYYLLGYHPARTTPDGKFHRIGVSVSRKDVVVRARRGYFAATDSGKAQAAPQRGAFQAALDSPYDIDGVPLRLAAYTLNEASPGKIRTAMVADVEVGQFRWERENDRYVNAVELLLLVANRKTDDVQRYDQTINLNLREETRAQLMASSLPIMREFELTPGRYFVKVVVRERNSGRMGTVAHEFTVPELGTLRLSSPVITDTFREVPGQTMPQLVMKAQRTFAAGGPLACQYEVYGAKVSPSDGKPHVSGGHAILRSDGTVVREIPATAINASSGGVARTVLFSSANLEPGQYQVVLKVKDEVAGQTVEAVEPFVITGPRATSRSPAQTPSTPTGTR